MKKYTIKQMEPEYGPWIMDDIKDLATFTKNENPIFISGNREFVGVNDEKLNELIKELENCIYDCECLEVFDNPESLDTPEEIVGGYFDHLHGKKLDEMIELVKGLEDYNDETIIKYLSLYYGEEYETRTIKGYCQGDWNTIYYPVSETDGTINYIEALYFGKYDEFYLEDEDCFSIVTHSDLWSDPKKAVAEAFNLNPEEVEVYEITSYQRVPTYQVMS